MVSATESDREDNLVNWKTEKRLSYCGAFALLSVPVVTLARMAGRSDRAFSRAGKASVITAATGGFSAGVFGLLTKTGPYDYHQEKATLAYGALGASLGGIFGALGSLTQDALRSR